MRELIQPTLFIIARTGLFLAVVLWVVGQWWHKMGVFYGAVGVLDNAGVAVGFQLSYVPFCNTYNRTLVDSFLNAADLKAPRYFSLGAVGFYIQPQSGCLAVRHWLIVTIFAAFNIVVHFIYRKRPEVQSCEN